MRDGKTILLLLEYFIYIFASLLTECAKPVFHTSHPQKVSLSTQSFIKSQKTFPLQNNFIVNRMESISVEVIPQEQQLNGTKLTFLRVLGNASLELKRSIREEREFCKIKIITQVTNTHNGCILVDHTHHNSVEMDETGEVAYRWVLMECAAMKKWTAKYFDISIEVVLEVHPKLRTAEAEEGYTMISRLVIQ